MKKQTTFILFITILLLTGCFRWEGVRGSGDIEDEYRDIESFEAIDISGAFHLKVDVGESSAIKISGDDNLLQYVRTRVRNGTLIIDSKKNINPRERITIVASTPDLVALEASGANKIKIRGIEADKFKTDISGACSVELAGEVDYFDVDISGATNLDAENLLANKVKIDCSGASSAEVFAKEAINADASGVSKITYGGRPDDVRSDASGISSIKRR